MELVLFPACSLAFAVVVVGYAVWLQPRRRARRLLRRATARPIGTIKHGEWAKITGVASALDPLLTSPLGEHECIGFRLDIERVDGANPTVFERQACGAFSITDDTGKVDLEGPFLFGLDAEGDYSTMRPRLLALLEAAGTSAPALASYRSFAFREALLKPGDQVTVVGQAFLEPDARAYGVGTRSPPLVLRMTGSGAAPVVIADADERISR
jgi:hypothetical protein